MILFFLLYIFKSIFSKPIFLFFMCSDFCLFNERFSSLLLNLFRLKSLLINNLFILLFKFNKSSSLKLLLKLSFIIDALDLKSFLKLLKIFSFFE